MKIERRILPLLLFYSSYSSWFFLLVPSSLLLLLPTVIISTSTDNENTTVAMDDSNLNDDDGEPPNERNENDISSFDTNTDTDTTTKGILRRRRSSSSTSMRRKWQKTFQEIRNLDDVTTMTTTKSWRRRKLDEWKLLLDVGSSRSSRRNKKKNGDGDAIVQPNDGDIDAVADTGLSLTDKDDDDDDEELTTEEQEETRQRFDGFATWEARLEQLTDDVAEYLAQSSSSSATTEGGYPMSTYGKPALTSAVTQEEEHDKEVEAVMVVQNNTPSTETSTKTLAATTRKQTHKISETNTFQPQTILPHQTPLPHTDLSDPSLSLWIVTTAAFPWMTGTAVNPLLRAAYLATARSSSNNNMNNNNSNMGNVTLMIPWLERRGDREEVYRYSSAGFFENKKEQENEIRRWLREDAGLVEASELLRIRWYTGRLYRGENSIYSMGDIIGLIPEDEVDICILEEPEHLNWYRAPGEGWTKKFKHVVGIVHTNYFVYAQEQPGALIRAPAMRLLCSWMCRAHCHRIIKLSGTLGSFAPEKELVENVHGVRKTFLDYGISLATELRLLQQQKQQQQQQQQQKQQHHLQQQQNHRSYADRPLTTEMMPQQAHHPVFGPDAQPTVYFIGKMLWSKGIGSLMDLLEYAEESAGLKVKVDMYGGGPNLEEARVKAEDMGLDMPFRGPIDHAELTSTHKIFVNPSLSEVLCTTVAEALAMGKFVVVPSHPSNDFFAQFPNCLTYANKEEFVGNLYYAMTHSPEPLSEEYTYALSWEAACKRFEAAGCISVEESEALKEAIATEEATVEFDLPQLIEDRTRRTQLYTTITKNRARYRLFRSKLSAELSSSTVLPPALQQTLTRELNRRLDLDVDTLLNSPSPKLRLQLSPAELDKRLLDFYDDMAGGPRGDVLRWIGAGGSGTVSAQWQYLRRMELGRKVKEEWGRTKKGGWGKGAGARVGGPVFLEDGGEAGRGPSATKWVKRVLRRNMQQGVDIDDDDDDIDGSNAHVGVGIGSSTNGGTSSVTGSSSSEFLGSKEGKGRRKTTDFEMNMASSFLSWGGSGGCDGNGYRRPQIGISLGSCSWTSSALYARPKKPVNHRMMRMSSSIADHRTHSVLNVGPLI